VVNKGFQDAVPALLEGSESVSGHRNTSVLVLLDTQVFELHFVEVNLVNLLILVFLGLNSLKLHQTSFVLVRELHLFVDVLENVFHL